MSTLQGRDYQISCLYSVYQVGVLSMTVSLRCCCTINSGVSVNYLQCKHQATCPFHMRAVLFYDWDYSKHSLLF